MNIYLIGYRGSGKTAVAAALSELLGWPWIDADAELETRAGKSIKQIFAEDGEIAFRDLESAVAEDLVEKDRCIVAWGGGVVLRDENRKLLKDRGQIVWLSASPETLLERINRDSTTAERRPNLTGQGGLVEICTLLERRIPLYRECAALTMDTERLTPVEVARQIIDRLEFPDGNSRNSA